jgi:hypothetical protein
LGRAGPSPTLVFGGGVTRVVVDDMTAAVTRGGALDQSFVRRVQPVVVKTTNVCRATVPIFLDRFL